MAQVPVTVTNGVPYPDPAKVMAKDMITFSADGTDYLIEFQRKGNPKHDPMCAVLPANGSVSLQADPNDQNGTCNYRILDSNGNPFPGSKAGSLKGGHSIIIGSGLESTKPSSRKSHNPRKRRK